MSHTFSGARLREVRLARSHTREQLAVALECSVSAIAAWERGRSTPTLSTFTRLCSALDVAPGDLFGTEDVSDELVDAPTGPA